MRVVSLLPAATEVVAQLLSSPCELVGVTHECDYPTWVRDRAVVVAPFDRDLPHLPPAEVDARVAKAAEIGQSIYVIDDHKLRSIAPDIIVTQGLCDVCAIGPDEVARAIATLHPAPAVVSLAPKCIVDVLDDIVRVGEAIGRTDQAIAWRDQLVRRLEWIASLPRIEPTPKVLVIEWPDPLWSAGHWVPEMIDLAGGMPIAGLPGQPSTRLAAEQISLDPPDFVLIASCGYDTRRNIEQLPKLKQIPGWNDWPAVKQGHVYAVDANSYFSRPAPRLVQGTELLMAILRGMPTPEEAVKKL
jgi:iron complex transport system substrate-binding protein